MPKTYSIYEAKSRLSELLRLVKEGIEITVNERGTPIAKVIPFSKDESLETLLNRLFVRGQFLRRQIKKIIPSSIAIKGGLRRFLKERE